VTACPGNRIPHSEETDWCPLGEKAVKKRVLSIFDLVQRIVFSSAGEGMFLAFPHGGRGQPMNSIIAVNVDRVHGN
jgi:hypothetical protein